MATSFSKEQLIGVLTTILGNPTESVASIEQEAKFTALSLDEYQVKELAAAINNYSLKLQIKRSGAGITVVVTLPRC